MKGSDGRYMFGAVKVGERGQIVIPKEAREVYGIKPGDLMLMLGDETGIAILRLDVFQDAANSLLSSLPKPPAQKEADDE